MAYIVSLILAKIRICFSLSEEAEVQHLVLSSKQPWWFRPVDHIECESYRQNWSPYIIIAFKSEPILTGILPRRTLLKWLRFLLTMRLLSQVKVGAGILLYAISFFSVHACWQICSAQPTIGNLILLTPILNLAEAEESMATLLELTSTMGQKSSVSEVDNFNDWFGAYVQGTSGMQDVRQSIFECICVLSLIWLCMTFRWWAYP